MKKTKISSQANVVPGVDDQNLKKLAEIETKALELQDKLSRSLADYSNLEKRIERDRQLFITLTSAAIVTKMVEVLDDLYLAYGHLQDPGLKMAIDKFVSVLKSEGLAEITAENMPFDPAVMEAIDAVEGEEDLVVNVKKKGYTLNGQVIRPAQVTVGRKLAN
jgi:molecular chaperone GrpE